MLKQKISSSKFRELYGDVPVVRSYSGKPGCMCGCRGKYNEKFSTAVRALNRLLNQNQEIWINLNDGGKLLFAYEDTETRTNVIYFQD